MSKRTWFLILSFIFISHLPYLNNGFTWIDHNDIEKGMAIHPLKELWKAFIIPFGQTGFYRPVVTIINSLDHSIYKNWAPGYHLTNILLQIFMTAVAVNFATLYWKLKERELAVLALAVGVHPASILIAGGITYRQESLLLLFVLLCLYYFRLGKHGLSAVFYFLALFTKETAIVVLPLLLLLLNTKEVFELLYKHKKTSKISLIILFPIVTLLYLLLRSLSLSSLWTVTQPKLTTGEHIATRLGLLAKELVILVSPLKPGFSDVTRVLDFSSLFVYLIILTLGCLVFYNFLIVRRGKASLVKNYIMSALAASVVTLLPGLNIVPTPRMSSPHYSYLPIPFVFSYLILLAQLQKKLLRKPLFIIFIIWLCISTYSTFRSGFYFKNDMTLFGSEIQTNKFFPEAYFYLGNYYLSQGNFATAADNFEKSLVLPEGYIAFRNTDSARMNLGTALLQNGDYNKAESIYENFLDRAPKDMKPYVLFNLSLLNYKKGDYRKSVEILESHEWHMADPYLLMAQIYVENGNIPKAKENIRKALPFLTGEKKLETEKYLEEF